MRERGSGLGLGLGSRRKSNFLVTPSLFHTKNSNFLVTPYSGLSTHVCMCLMCTCVLFEPSHYHLCDGRAISKQSRTRSLTKRRPMGESTEWASSGHPGPIFEAYNHVALYLTADEIEVDDYESRIKKGRSIGLHRVGNKRRLDALLPTLLLPQLRSQHRCCG